MRLYLNGRSTPSMLQTQLEQAITTQCYTTVRLSCWDFEAVDAEITQQLIAYLQAVPFHQLEDVTLQNCTGGADSSGGGQQARSLLAAIVQSSPKSFTIRYDQQQTELSTSITSGLIEGAKLGSRLQAFQLKGVTLTASVVESLRIALSKLPELMSLSIQSNFTLIELDRKHVSILGRNSQDIDDVFYEMIRLLRELPRLTTLDLKHCHIPDTYLAELLRAARKTSLRNLHLRGNMAQEETMTILSEWMMMTKECPLEHLDLSWQRLFGTKSNCSPFCAQMPFLAKAIRYNTSLKVLRISENRLSDADINLLISALAHNKTIQELELKDCRISMSGFRSIAKHLPMFQLERLDMNGCQQVAAAELIKLKSLFFKPLSQNVYLLDFVLPQGVESKSLAWLLEWNKAGRRVLTDSRPRLEPSMWPKLLERADRVGRRASDRQPERHAATAIYYLFREKGFSVVTRHREQTRERGEQKQDQLQQNIQPTGRVRGLVTPPTTPRRDEVTTPRRISPTSSFEGSRSSLPVLTSSPVDYIPRESGEIELRLLEESSSFDKVEPKAFAGCGSTTTKPSAKLARPRLMAHRTSSTSSTTTTATASCSGHVDLTRKWMMPLAEDAPSPSSVLLAPRTAMPSIDTQ